MLAKKRDNGPETQRCCKFNDVPHLESKGCMSQPHMSFANSLVNTVGIGQCLHGHKTELNNFPVGRVDMLWHCRGN